MKKDKLFEKNILPFYQIILKYLYSQTRDRPLSEDLAQETMRISWEKLGQVRKPGSYKTWVMQVAHNVLVYKGENVPLSVKTVRIKVVDQMVSLTSYGWLSLGNFYADKTFN